MCSCQLFLSTPPSRVATAAELDVDSCLERVSIHATLAGGDLEKALEDTNKKLFLSTPPSRVATTTLM